MATNLASAKTQTATITTSSAETTIITADPQLRLHLTGLIITCITAAAAAVLSVRSATGGAVRMAFDYPTSAAVPGVPFTVNFDPPLEQREGANNNWTIQSSVATDSFKITATFVAED
jgi:hypothetical protein